MELPVEASGTVAPPATAIERLTGWVAVLGGLVAMAVALLATASVVMRWLFNSPIDGDFEYVKIATAVAVFAYLPFTQARRSNIMVDTFTGWLPVGVRRVMDAFWDLVYAAIMAYLSYCMVYGTLAAIASRETTMQRQLLIWPSIALSTALAALVVLTALATALRLYTARNSGSMS